MIITCSITWHVPTSLSLHTLSIEVSTRVSSIIQNQTRAFSGASWGTAWQGRILALATPSCSSGRSLDSDVELAESGWQWFLSGGVRWGTAWQERLLAVVTNSCSSGRSLESVAESARGGAWSPAWTPAPRRHGGRRKSGGPGAQDTRQR